MTKYEKRAKEQYYKQIYGNCLYVIKYETKYSKGHLIIKYEYYMLDDKIRRRIDKFIKRKDIIKLDIRFIKAERNQDDII